MHPYQTILVRQIDQMVLLLNSRNIGQLTPSGFVPVSRDHQLLPGIQLIDRLPAQLLGPLLNAAREPYQSRSVSEVMKDGTTDMRSGKGF